MFDLDHKVFEGDFVQLHGALAFVSMNVRSITILGLTRGDSGSISCGIGDY